MKDLYIFEIFPRWTLRGRRFFWRCVAGNGEIVAAGHPRGFESAWSARKTIHRVQLLASRSEIVEVAK